MEVSYGVKGEIIIDRKNVVICSGTVWMVIAVRFNIKLASLLLPARRGIHRAGADFVHSSRISCFWHFYRNWGYYCFWKVV